MDKQIYLFLKKLRKRLGLQKALDIFPLFLAMGCITAFLPVCISYFHPFYYADKIGFFLIIFSFIIGSIYFFLHFPKEIDAAHMGDHIIGQERLLTSLELRGNESAISCLQKEDSIYHISNCNLKTDFPYHIPFQRIAAFLFVLSLFLLFLFLPSNAKTTALKLHEIKQQAKEEIAALEEIQKGLARNDKDSMDSADLEEKSLKEKKQELSSLLEEAKEEYRLAESEKDLTKTKERLKAKAASISAKAKKDKEWNKVLSLASSLGLPLENNFSNNSQETKNNNNTKNNETNHNSEAETDTQVNSSENNENIENNNNDSSSNEDNNNSNTNSDNSNTGDTADSNQNGSSNDNNSSTSKDPSDSDSRNKSNSGNSSGETLKSNENNSNNNSNSNSANSSNNNSNSNNNGNSNSKGNSSENIQTGKAGNKNKNGSKGSSGYNYGSKKGIEKKEETVKEPEQITIRENAIGEDENLTGISSKDGDFHMESGTSPLAPGVKKDFYDVVGDYTQKAYSAVENNKVPSAMTDIVKDYFSNLNS